MAMDRTCMIVIGVVGGVALLAILAAIAFCIAFVMFCRKSQAVADSSKKTPASSKTPTDSSKKTPEDDTSKTPTGNSKTPEDDNSKTPANGPKTPDKKTPTGSSKKTPTDGSKKTVAIVDSSKKKLIYQDQSTQLPAGSSEEVIKANNVTLAEWQKKVIALTQSIRDFVYRPQRADLSQWVTDALFTVFGDIETIQAQNTDLTPPAFSAVLYIWLNSRNDRDDLKPDNIDKYLARDDIQNAVAGLPDDQVRNLIKALADLSGARRLNRQCGAKLYDATTALRSADRTLSGLHFSNNSPYCQIGIAEFDNDMQSVASHLTQARKLITDCMYLYKIPPLSYPVYGGSPGQSLIYNSADSPKKTPTDGDGDPKPTINGTPKTPTNDGSGASIPTYYITYYISPKTPVHVSSPQEVVIEWQKKALSLRQPILDFAYRQYRVFGREVHETTGRVFGDIETIRAQNTALTSLAVSTILHHWVQSYTTPNKLTRDNIDEFLALDNIKNAVVGLPNNQVHNFLNGLADLSRFFTKTVQSVINLYDATLALSSADSLLSGLQFANNLPSCQIGIAEFDNNMESVALSLTQAREFITTCMATISIEQSSYSVYGGSPDQSLAYTTPLSAGGDPKEAVADQPAGSSDTVIIANNAILSEWREKAIALTRPIRDCAFRAHRAKLKWWLNDDSNDNPSNVYGDLETIRTQNTDLTSTAISTILRHWTQSYGTHSDLTHDNIDDFLALDDVKEAVAELPYNQVRNLLNALVALSDRSAKARQAGFNLYLANFALRSADSILSALHFSNNSPFCQIGIAEFDTYMQSVATHLTQAREFIKHVQTAYNIPSDRYPVYGDTPTQLLTYELRPPSTDSPTTAASSVSGPTPPLVLNS